MDKNPVLAATIRTLSIAQLAPDVSSLYCKEEEIGNINVTAAIGCIKFANVDVTIKMTNNWGTSSKYPVLDRAEAFISLYNNSGTYYSESVQRFRIAAVPQYPKLVFQTSSAYLTSYYLPSQSSYALKDTETNEYVIEFDETYTKISADETSSYFDIYMGGLEPERYYTILLKTTIDGTTKVFDEDILFKVTNG